MACAHPKYQGASGRLTVADAENGWFVRVDHIHSYGTAPNSNACASIPRAAHFLNHYIVPAAPASLGARRGRARQSLPNPRVILPAACSKRFSTGRSGSTCAASASAAPHPQGQPALRYPRHAPRPQPRLAWLWRLWRPRSRQPSIQATKSREMQSEGVAPIGPLHRSPRGPGQPPPQPDCQHPKPLRPHSQPAHRRLEGRIHGRVDGREYLAAAAAPSLPASRSAKHLPLLGYIPNQLRIEGSMIPRVFWPLKSRSRAAWRLPGRRAPVAGVLFERTQAVPGPDLDPLGKRIIEACSTEPPGRLPPPHSASHVPRGRGVKTVVKGQLSAAIAGPRGAKRPPRITLLSSLSSRLRRLP